MPAPVAAPTTTREEAGPVGSSVPWDFRGVHYVFREITVEENDNCIDAARNPDGETINNRVLTRLMVIASCVEPKGFDLAALIKLPYKAYAHIVELVNDINDESKLDEGPNASAPDGSAEPK